MNFTFLQHTDMVLCLLLCAKSVSKRTGHISEKWGAVRLEREGGAGRRPHETGMPIYTSTGEVTALWRLL
jgi:hypothetical protein